MPEKYMKLVEKGAAVRELNRLRLENARLKSAAREKARVNKKTNEYVKILYKELERKNKKLERLNLLKSQFVANVSHEIKNPLTIIRDSIDLILTEAKGATGPVQKHILAAGKKSANRLLRLVMDLLDVSRIEAGKVRLKKTKVDLRLVVGELADTCKASLSKKRIILKKDFPEKITLIHADKDRLADAVANLLSNATKYSHRGGRITIKIRETVRRVYLAISDTGPGIPKKYLRKIFDKFERVSADKEEGSGLGLPIAKDIIKLHGGQIYVESIVGRGSTFTFMLPKTSIKKQASST